MRTKGKLRYGVFLGLEGVVAGLWLLVYFLSFEPAWPVGVCFAVFMMVVYGAIVVDAVLGLRRLPKHA